VVFSELRLHTWLPNSFQKVLPALTLTTPRVAFKLPSPTKALFIFLAWHSKLHAGQNKRSLCPLVSSGDTRLAAPC